MPGTRKQNVIDLFHEQAEKTPSRVAVAFKETSLSYQQLDEASNQLAHLLILNGVKKETLVAIYLERSLEMIVCILGVLKAGGAYVPLDPMFPQDRIAFMLEDSESEILLTSTSLPQHFAIDIKTVFLDKMQSIIRQQNKLLPDLKITGYDLAYTLYTSGSTGKPKGVQIEHRNLLNFIESMKSAPGMSENDTLLALTTVSFDIAGLELLLPLVSGAKLILADDALRIDGHRILDTIIAKKVTFVQATPATWRMLLDAGWQTRLPLKALCGGEAFPLELAKQMLELCDEVWNVYGPTETTIWSTLKKLEKDRFPITIGQPIKDTKVYILDDCLRPLEPGEVGELFIGGNGVARGYLKRPELNTEKFISDPFASTDGARMYRTGDLGRFLPNGEIQCLGRIDNQVKIQGFRIELGEIENTISRFPGIKQNCVHVWEEQHAGKRLAGYLIASKEHPIDLEGLTDFLGKELPDYMVPDTFVQLDALPLTDNGKVDRKALPRPLRERPQTGTLYRAPKTAVEQHIVDCWKTLFGIDKIGIDDNFFDLGGNSILATKTVAWLKEAYGVILPVTKIYQHPTASRIAMEFDGEKQYPRTTSREKNNAEQKKGGDVAIIGMAGRFPGAKTIGELWHVLREGRETIKFFGDEEMDPSLSHEVLSDPNYVKARGIIEDTDSFDPDVFGLNPTLVKLMDPQQRIFLEICRDVLEQTGYLDPETERLIGVYAGTGNNTYFMNNVQHHPEEIAKIGEFQVMLANEKDYTATRVAYQLNLKGPAMGIGTACSASLVAVIQAVDAIRSGQCELAIAGGISITVPVNSGQRFEDGAMFSVDGHTRTFDAQATGTVFSDGAGVVLLKDLESARIDGDTIYAVIQGVGLSNDGRGKGSFMAPSAEGQAQAIRMAMDDARILPDDIGYIEAHGTATPIGDPIEIEGLKLAFGETTRKQYCRIGSIKSNLGHLTHAAGIAGLIKATLSLYHGTLPVSINFEEPNPNIDFSESPFVVNNESFELSREKPFIAGISSFGVGGTNAHVIIRSHHVSRPSYAQSATAESPTLITWSAKTQGAGQGYAKKLADYLQNTPGVSLESVAYTLQRTREKMNFRYSMVVRNREESIEQLSSGNYLQSEIKEQVGDLVFLFPGQGAQYPGMGCELYRCEPAYRDAVDECAEILKHEIGEDIRQLIFPTQALSSEQAAEVLKNTRYTQPALFITSYALAKLWASWGIRPTAFIGHSIGEFVAATLSGIFSLADALKLIAIRAKLSASVRSGSMLAVRASAEEIQVFLPDVLSLAAKNAPQLCVVAGADDQIASFSSILEEKGISCKPLHTSHAFHSKMMKQILDPFKEAVAGVKLSTPKLPVISTVTGRWLTDRQAQDPAYWADHMISTVLFSDAVKFAEQELDAPLYVEAGPGQVTATLTKQHGSALSERVVHSIRAGDNDECLSTRMALAKIWMRGIDPQWNALYEQVHATLHTLPTYAYDRKQYWVYGTGPNEKKETANLQKSQPEMRNDKLIAQVRSMLENASGIDLSKASLNANFIELGLDSLLLTQVAQNLKKAFNVSITFRMLNEECHNLNLLAAFIENQLPREVIPMNLSEPSITQPQARLTPQPPAVPHPDPNNLDALSLIAQQISLISQQIALLQHTAAQSSPISSGPQDVSTQATTATLPAITTTTRDKTGDRNDMWVPQEALTESKKKHEARASIKKATESLSIQQQVYLNDLIEKYVRKTAKSKAYTQQHRVYMAAPHFLSGFGPQTKEITYALIVNKSSGCKLWDIDGNEYIDATNGFGSSMLGNQPEFIKKALLRQIEDGNEASPQHEMTDEICKLVREFTGMDRIGICNAGPEAILGAIRIARTVTGRTTVVAFSGSHRGFIPEAAQNMLIMDYGTEESLHIIRERAHELAAVLVEPIQSGRPEFVPVSFLKEVREITANSGTALIFDEVISGFRFHPRGAQGMLGITADLGTYGEVAGTGISMGIIAGKKQFMDALDGRHWQFGDDSASQVDVPDFRGMLVRYPLALAGTKATLEYLKQEGPALQENLNRHTGHLANEMNSAAQRYGAPIFVTHFGSLWKIKFKQEYPSSELLFTLMRYRGIHIQDGLPCFLTTAHGEEDVKKIIHAFEGSLHELIKSGLIPTSGDLDVHDLPPLPNARLGTDTDGKPAWFIADEQRPGRYLQIEEFN